MLRTFLVLGLTPSDSDCLEHNFLATVLQNHRCRKDILLKGALVSWTVHNIGWLNFFFLKNL